MLSKKKLKQLIQEQKEEIRARLKQWKARQKKHPTPPPVTPPPQTPTPFVPYLVRVLYYHEITGKSKWEAEGKTHASPPSKAFADPATWKMLADNGRKDAPFARVWQDYWLELMSAQIRRQNPDAPESSVYVLAVKLFDYAFRSNTVMCNKNGGSYGDKTIKLECITMGGNVHKVVGRPKRKAGVMCVPVRVCNSNDMPPQVGEYCVNIYGTIETNIIKYDNQRDRVTRSFEALNFVRGELPRGIIHGSTTWIPYTLICNGCDIAWLPEYATVRITEDDAARNVPF